MKPFVLSLSKDCPSLIVKSEMQVFDKLRPNGFWDLSHRG
jgi:hypothetical protein